MIYIVLSLIIELNGTRGGVTNVSAEAKTLLQDCRRVTVDKGVSRVRNAARTLLSRNNKLPEARREELREIVCAHFHTADVTPELLTSASQVCLEISCMR